MSEIFFKELKIVHLCNARLKNSYISIKPHYEDSLQCAKIVLKTPRVSQKFIYELLSNRELWIRKQILKIQQTQPKQINIEDEVLIFGEIYSIDSKDTSTLREKLTYIKTEDTKKILKCYDDFYLDLAKNYLSKRVEYFSKIMELEYSAIRFKKTQKQVGSCDSKKVITLNTQLIKVKKELIDYVVVHELAHIRHMNHSKDFHLHVEKYLPQSQRLRKILKSTHL